MLNFLGGRFADENRLFVATYVSLREIFETLWLQDECRDMLH